jgi:hypothetical protein
MATANPQVAANAPVHTSGLVTGADGIGWRFDRNGTDTFTVTENITVRNSRMQKQWLLDSPSSAVANRHVTPGFEGRNVLRNVKFENVVWNPTASGVVFSGEGRVEQISFDTCRFVGGNWSAMITQSDIASTWIDGIKWADLHFQNCFFEITNAWVGVVNQKHPQQRYRITGYGNRIGENNTTAGWLHAKIDAANTDIPLRNDMLTLTTGDTARAIRSGVGQVVMSHEQHYIRGRWFDPFGLDHVDLLGIAPTLVASGTSSAATQVPGGKIRLHTGNNNNGFALAKIGQGILRHSTEGANFTQPAVLSGRIIARASNNGVIRLLVGASDTLDSGFSANADADADNDKFYGWEIRRAAASSGNMQIRAIGHNGTAYEEGAWHDTELASSFVCHVYWELLSDGKGKVELRVGAAAANATSTSAIRPEISTLPVSSLADGPIGLGTNGRASIWVVATTNGSDTANTTIQCEFPPSRITYLDF